MTSAADVVVSWRGRLFDLLFPPRCVNCRRPGESFCPACRARIRFVAPPICTRCGAGVPASGTLCYRCRLSPPYLERIRAIGYFEGVLREAIHAYKYKARRELAEPLAAVMQEHLPFRTRDLDAVTAVPLHPSRQQERGYNQSELLGRELAVRLSLPYIGGIERVRATPDQVGSDFASRRENVRDAFSADASAFRGRSVLLVDDVCTTGATLDECARALGKQGARRVYGLAVARPDASG